MADECAESLPDRKSEVLDNLSSDLKTELKDYLAPYIENGLSAEKIRGRAGGFDDPLLDAREPDIALVNDEGAITGYAEAKLALLDDRSRHQLAASGAKATFLRFTRYLRENYEHLAEWNLPELAAKNKKDIAVAKEGFDRVLVVPADRDIEDSESLISRRPGNGLSEAGYQELKNILENEIRIARSPFSLKDVWSLTDSLLKDNPKTKT